ncbi:LLM class flavin-dependent oxidoreductase [Streptomyces sp. NPDC020192]|uniref:LLM class flavin-dependent oxidoreductase n=1 Tax=Streptomyces sp. NPDC020192 TaxID=3365066 RepID=UPI0037AB9AF6
MPEYGYFLSCEEFAPDDLIEQARTAEQAGFRSLWISDHYHPWNDAQGQSPFVRSVIGTLSEAVSLPVETAVTCATMTGGRFRLGVGSGEALNEHILGGPWPPTSVRLEMLEEAIQVMRRLFSGEEVSHDGPHYRVENARLHTVPDESLVSPFLKAGGAGKTISGGTKVCYGTDRDEAVRTARRLWFNELLPGETAQTLPSPRHFEQLEPLVTERMVRDNVVCGDDVDAHLAALNAFAEAGFDRTYVTQIGPDQRGFFDFYRTKVLPQLPLD